MAPIAVKRPRRPMAGVMPHREGSTHPWLQGRPALDLIVTMDDATSGIHSAFLVAREGTASSFQGLAETISGHGLFRRPPAQASRPPAQVYRPHFVRAKVRLHEYPDGAVALFWGPHRIADFEPDGCLRHLTEAA